jgi:GTP-binding protein EngB required for normal cell division
MNENHRRHLRVAFRHVDRLLSDAAQVLASADAGSPFAAYAADATPVQRRVIEDYVRRVRTLMAAALERMGIPLEPPTVGAVRAASTSILYAEIALEESEAQCMRGYGAMSDEDARELDEGLGELQPVLKQMRAYLALGSGADLQARLARLEGAPGGTALLQELARVITAHGLLELRPSLSLLADQMESDSFEIAVFGRVSSGKSSLLNHVVRRGVLPVGVTPITAVPVRITYGAQPRGTVRFADREPLAIDLTRLAEFATEQENPGNGKHVTAIAVELQEERLRGGVTLVDTPGLGSLATSGGAEALAYLPRADLGVVLTDAASTLNPEDVAVVERLLRSGAKAMVLISKADILAPPDRERLADYVRRHLASELGAEVPVYLASVVEGALADDWLEHALLPLFQEQKALRRVSLRRKAAALREAVVAALRSRLERRPSQPPAQAFDQWEEVQRALRRATGLVDPTARACEDLSSLLASSSEGVIEKAAAEIASRDSAEAAAILRRVTAAFESEVAVKLLETLDGARVEMSRALRTAAALLDGAEPEEDELPPPRGMPILDVFPVAGRLVVRDTVARLLGGGLRRRAIAEQIREQVAAPLRELLTFHGRRLREWWRATLAELEKAFEARAAPLRARMELPAPAAGAPEEDRAVIEHDLEILDGWPGQGAR